MMYSESFDYEFLTRTQEIIKNAQDFKYDVTLLLNCMLSLICLPLERINENYYNAEEHYDRLFSILCKKLRSREGVILYEKERTPDKQLLKCLRNAIAHLKMEPIHHSGEIIGVRVKGKTMFKNKAYQCEFALKKDFLIYFTDVMVTEYLKLSDPAQAHTSRPVGGK